MILIYWKDDNSFKKLTSVMSSISEGINRWQHARVKGYALRDRMPVYLAYLEDTDTNEFIQVFPIVRKPEQKEVIKIKILAVSE